MDPAASRPATVPHFPVELVAPDLGPWLRGNTGIPGVSTFESGVPGPHVAIVSLLHGNEISGAIVMDRMMRERLRPVRGRLTLAFANLSAYARFDPAQPTASRFLDEDMNRVWDPAVLDGPRGSSELDRARALRPVMDRVDVLLDLHSMLWPSEALILSGPTAKGRRLAASLGVPDLVVADRGHLTGPRLIDYVRFTGPDEAAACLVEAGQHWQAGTVAVTEACVRSLLLRTGLANGTADMLPASRCAEVTEVVTAATSGFAFVQSFRGGDVISRRNTLIALDGTTEIRTPHDECLLVMPSLRASRGHTAVRMARFLPQ